MKKIGYCLFFVLFSVSALCSCSLTDDDEDFKEDSALEESLVGLWYGQSADGMTQVLDLRADRTAVSSTYIQILHGSSTSYYPEWTAGYYQGRKEGNGYLIVGGRRMPCDYEHLKMQDGTTLDYYSLRRLYNPSSDTAAKKMVNLTYPGEWVGYFEEKIITLVFHEDGTMTRIDKPNAGWEGEKTETVYNWSVDDNVLHLSGPGEAWGVTVEEDFNYGDVIFVDFGDVASVFC